MKRWIACFLAALLLLSALPLAGAAFTDEDKIRSDYKAAVAEMAEKKIINGFEDGSFKPSETLTRAQAAKILCVLLEGEEKANALTKTETGFADVPASHWAAKFVAYCAEKGIVAGVGDGKFNPDGKLSFAAFAKMLLVACGEDGAQFTGAEWTAAVKKAAPNAFLNYKIEEFSDRDLPRQQAAQLAWNAQFSREANEAATKDMESRPYPTATSIPKSLKIISLGSSFSNNCVLGYTYEMLKDVGVEDLTLACSYASGASLSTYIKGIKDSEETTFTYYKRNGDKWKTNKKWTLDQELADEDWDIVSFMQTPSKTYQPMKNYLMYYVQKTHPNANFVWNVIWAHSNRSKQSAFVKSWNGDQMGMYSGMVQLARQYVEPDPRIRAIIPVGTAIQNARTSFIGDNLDRDTYHLNKSIGYYIASMMWTCKLLGVTPDQIKYVPKDGLLENPPHGFDKDTPGLSEALVAVAKESVANALANPYEVTPSKLTEAPKK